MYYGIYKGVRNNAWQCIVDFNVDSLPVDVLKIAFQAKIHVKRNSDVHDLLPDERGKTYFDGKEWTIIYNDLNPTVVSRFTIAHELGHIFLGHELTFAKYSHINEVNLKPSAERQADMFATRLLCPACVIYGLRLTSPEDIAAVCRVDIDVARTRAKRMRTLYARNRFFTDPLEREAFEKFEMFINDKRTALSKAAQQTL